MPSQLAERHRRAQLALRAQTLRDLLKLWPAFNLNNIKGSWEPFEEALLLLIKARGQTSAGIASSFYRDNRQKLGIRGKATPVLVTPDVDEAVRGLRVVGPANAGLQLAKKRPIETVAKNALVLVSGEATRHVLNAGRRTLGESLVADARVNKLRTGIRRVTDSSPCSFCSSLSGRVLPATADFKVHGHCGCNGDPVYL